MNLLEEKMNADVRYLNSIVEKEEIKEEPKSNSDLENLWE